MKSWLLNNNFLYSLLLELTDKCNLKCIHCFNDKKKSVKNMSFDEIKPVIDEAFKLGVFNIILSGGECTLNNDFLKIARYIKEKRISLEIFTNAQKLYDDDFYNEVLSLYPYRIGISLYSMRADIHDNITGVLGSWHKTISVIKKLRSQNVNVQIKCFQLMNNSDYYSEVVDF